MNLDHAIVKWHEARVDCRDEAKQYRAELDAEISRMGKDDRDLFDGLIWDLEFLFGNRSSLPLAEGESLADVLARIEKEMNEECGVALFKDPRQILRDLRKVPLGTGKWTPVELAHTLSDLYRDGLLGVSCLFGEYAVDLESDNGQGLVDTVRNRVFTALAKALGDEEAGAGDDYILVGRFQGQDVFVQLGLDITLVSEDPGTNKMIPLDVCEPPPEFASKEFRNGYRAALRLVRRGFLSHLAHLEK